MPILSIHWISLIEKEKVIFSLFLSQGLHFCWRSLHMKYENPTELARRKVFTRCFSTLTRQNPWFFWKSRIVSLSRTRSTQWLEIWPKNWIQQLTIRIVVVTEFNVMEHSMNWKDSWRTKNRVSRWIIRSRLSQVGLSFYSIRIP